MATRPTEVTPPSTIACQQCGHSADEAMPSEARQRFYECASCGVALTPQADDCCVFCCYGTAACPRSRRGAPAATRSAPGQ